MRIHINPLAIKVRVSGAINRYLPQTVLNQLRVIRGHQVRYIARRNGAARVSSFQQFASILGFSPVVVVGHAMGGGSNVILNVGLANENDVILLEGGVDGKICIRDNSTNQIVGTLDRDLNGKLDYWLNSIRPRVVIVNHLLGHENWAAKIPNIDAPVVLNLHDRYWLTQIPFHLPGLSESIDSNARGINIRLNMNDIAEVPDSEWRSFWSEILKRADVVFAPSFDLAADYVGLTSVPISVEYPTLLIGNGTEFKAASHRELPSWMPGDVLRLVSIGGGMPHKGSSDLNRLILASKEIDVPIHITVFGSLSPISGLVPSADIELRGELTRTELISFLRSGKFHFAWFPLRSPEAYCMALDDAVEAGLLPIARSVGAVEEHLAVLGTGLVWDGELSDETMIAEMVALMKGEDLKYLREPIWSPPAGMAPATFGTWNWAKAIAQNTESEPSE